MWSLCGRWWRRRRALAAAAAACAALLMAAALWPTRTEQVARVQFSHTPPHALAHLLADFTNHPKLHPHLGSWTLEDEGGNYTHWWYSVSYECGARCRGRATMRAHQLGAGAAGDVALRHGPAAAHRVLLAHRACDQLPLLSWPTMCEEWEIDSLITPLEGSGSGSQVRERWTARCGLTGCPGGSAPLVDRATRRLQRLRALLFEKQLLN